jgi:hypothetical protein
MVDAAYIYRDIQYRELNAHIGNIEDDTDELTTPAYSPTSPIDPNLFLNSTYREESEDPQEVSARIGRILEQLR